MPETLLKELQTLARTLGGELTWFADRMEGLPRTPGLTPRGVKVLDGMADRLGNTTDLSAPATQALLNAAPHLAWTQSYDSGDGFSRHYLDNYGFVNLVSPQGFFHSDEMRISVGFWGDGLRYPSHAHEPEEWYVMLAGGCTLTSEHAGTRPVPAGGVAHHEPWEKHAADFNLSSLLAVAYWRGDGLMDKSIIYEAP